MLLFAGGVTLPTISDSSHHVAIQIILLQTRNGISDDRLDSRTEPSYVSLGIFRGSNDVVAISPNQCLNNALCSEFVK